MYVTMLDYVHISYMAWNYIMRTYTTTSDYMEVDNERTRIYLYKKLLYLNEVLQEAPCDFLTKESSHHHRCSTIYVYFKHSSSRGGKIRDFHVA